MKVTRKKKIFLILTLLMLFGVAFGYWRMRAIKVSALRLAQTGRSAKDLLGQLGHALKDGDFSSIPGLYAPGLAQSSSAWQKRLETEQADYRIFRWDADGEARNDSSRMDGFWESMLQDVSRLDMAKLKIDRLEQPIKSTGPVHFGAMLWIRGTDMTGAIFETKVHIRFAMVQVDGLWKLTGQELMRGETVAGKGEGFQDVAQERGLDFESRHNPIYATPQWALHRYGIFRYAASGVAASDVDGDGYEDLFFADGVSARLYLNRQGQFEDATEAWGLPTDLSGFNVALFADFDNDGQRDLFLGGLTTSSRLFRNLSGRFSEVDLGQLVGGPLVTVAAAADYDNDGDLDLYYGRYLDPRSQLPTTLFYTRNGAGNTLLRNEGNFRFTDVTQSAGVREGGLTLGVAWGDIDADGDQDLYVANDFGRNAMLRNNGDGTFSDVSRESGTLDFGFGMSASFADADNDGDLDLYVSNIHSGQRWYGQAATLYSYIMNSVRQGTFYQDWPLYREIYALAGENWHHYGDRMVKGNSLFINDGRGRFQEISEQANANPHGWYWGSQFFDMDQDGLLDIYAANGWITAKSHDDL